MTRRRRVVTILATVVALVLVGAPSAAAQDGTDAKTINVVAIGDSIGFGLWDLQGGYARRYVSLLEDDGYTVRFTNLSVPGWETEDLLHAVTTSSLFKDTITNADVVLAEIGGNDLDRFRSVYLSACTSTHAPPAPDVSGLLSRAGMIAQEVDSLVADDAQILTFTLYNPYVDQDRGVTCGGADALDVLNGSLLTYNTAIERSALVTSADVYEEFNTGFFGQLVDPARKWYLAFDDFHPNFRGHQKIADLLLAVTDLT